MTKIAALLLYFITITCVAQGRAPLNGQVIAGGAAVGGIFVINTTTGTEVKTANDGTFTLDARVGDRLAVYSSTFTAREFAVNQWSLNQKPYILEAAPKATELEEVVVTGITAESLDIVPMGPKRYTQMERKMYTTGNFKPIMLLGLIGGSMPLDPLINAINGRAKRVKKELLLERTRLFALQFNEAYTDDDLKSFGLKTGLERGFIYYIAEDSAVRNAMKAGNKPLLEFRLTELALTYSTLHQENE